MLKNIDKWLLTVSLIVFLVGEVLFSLYANFQGSQDSIERAKQEAIRQWKNSSLAVEMEKALKTSLANIDSSIAQKHRQNAVALEEGRAASVRLFDEKVRQDEKTKSEKIAAYEIWYEEELAKIIKPFEDKAKRASEENFLGLGTGIMVGVVGSLAALWLNYLSNKQGTDEVWAKSLFGLSFIPQFVVCLTIWHGAMIRLSWETGAWSISIMYFVCMPVIYHRSFRYLSACAYTGVTKTRLTSIKADGHRVSLTVWSKDADGWVRAIRDFQKEKDAGNGQGMLSEIARYFDANKNQVRRALIDVSEGKPIPIPKRLRSPLPVGKEYAGT